LLLITLCRGRGIVLRKFFLFSVAYYPVISSLKRIFLVFLITLCCGRGIVLQHICCYNKTMRSGEIKSKINNRTSNKSNKKKIDKLSGKIARNILKGTLSATAWTFDFLANAGVLTVEVFLNPSLYHEPSYVTFKDCKNYFVTKEKFDIQETAIKQSIWRLRRAGFVAKKGSGFYLTQKGKELASYILGRKTVLAKKWDKKYRVVIFDIPEKKKKTRDWLRQELLMLGYKKLQESVFIGKHPLPADLIKSIKNNEIGNCVNYLLIERTYKNVF
jgi:hypothetical protein